MERDDRYVERCENRPQVQDTARSPTGPSRRTSLEATLLDSKLKTVALSNPVLRVGAQPCGCELPFTPRTVFHADQGGGRHPSPPPCPQGRTPLRTEVRNCRQPNERPPLQKQAKA